MTLDEIEREISSNVSSQLNNLDFSVLDNIVKKLSEGELSIFGGSSFIDKVKEIVSGEFATSYESLFRVLLGFVFDEVLAFLPILALLVGVAVLGSIVSSLRSGGQGGVSELVHFVCYGVIVVIVSYIFIDFVVLTTETINLIKTQMDVVFPILLTVMTAMGGVVSANIYQPAVLIFSNVIMQLVRLILVPLIIFSFIFTILSNISSGIKLDKFVKFFSSSYKWIVGTSFTIFMAFLTLQGITASVYDGVSVRTARYAIKGTVPIVGGFLGDGFDMILAGSGLIKNAVGVVGIVLLLAIVLIPIIQMVIFSLGIRLVSAVIEPICDSKISNFLYGVSKCIPMLIACILAVSFVYMIMITLIMFTANAF
ncbi:MAG: stage III sporulation protein AE [Firmicutes bacterium]|nr:stage III sporulation protein AE [Bacillota bacterium]